jgi:AcrR family transcriptional regulator
MQDMSSADCLPPTKGLISLNQRVKMKIQRATAGRRRRSTKEVLDRLIDAACEEFESNGYTRSKTATIARKAGVSETLLFRHFGSKANLFHDTIFNPFSQHFAEFKKSHPIAEGDSEGRLEITRQYIGEVQEFLSRHSGMLTLLITSQSYESDEVKGIDNIKGLHDYLLTTSKIIESRLKESPNMDPLLMACISFATILSCTIFKDWLFPPGAADDRTINDAVTNFVIGGVNANLTKQ